MFCVYESPVDSVLCEEILDLGEAVFGAGDRLDSTWRIRNMPQLTVVGARFGKQLVGFKTGYAVTSRRYYSWLGGVHPDFRRAGLARKLMQMQHDWIRDNGFSSVETKVLEDNAAMRELNAAAGFVQVGNKLTGDTNKLILRKSVVQSNNGQSPVLLPKNGEVRT